MQRWFARAPVRPPSRHGRAAQLLTWVRGVAGPRRDPSYVCSHRCCAMALFVVALQSLRPRIDPSGLTLYFAEWRIASRAPPSSTARCRPRHVDGWCWSPESWQSWRQFLGERKDVALRPAQSAVPHIRVRLG